MPVDRLRTDPQHPVCAGGEVDVNVDAALHLFAEAICDYRSEKNFLKVYRIRWMLLNLPPTDGEGAGVRA